MTRAIFFAFAEFERDMIVERTREGKAIKREKGELKEGRKPFEVTEFPLYRDKVENKEITVVSGCKECGISPTWWYNLVAKEG